MTFEEAVSLLVIVGLGFYCYEYNTQQRAEP